MPLIGFNLHSLHAGSLGS